MIKVAIIGATSHIAKGLIKRFVNSKTSLSLYSRNTKKVESFLLSQKLSSNIKNLDYSSGLIDSYDVLINCVGFGTTRTILSAGSEIFEVFEFYDNLCLNYIKRNPNTLYIYFSSGAIYGTKLNRPATKDSVAEYKPNCIEYKDYYRFIKLYTEAKHRSLEQYKIWDIRVFNYLSEFVDQESGMLITEIVNSIINKSEFITNQIDIVRDFSHPNDLFQLLMKIIQKNEGNGFLDLYSKQPVRKFDLLDFLHSEYNLQYQVKDHISTENATGVKNLYFSNYTKASNLFDFHPQKTSLQTIEDVLNKILGREE